MLKGVVVMFKAKLLLLSLLVFSADLLASGQKRPNILLLMAEDMSLKVGAFGDSVAQTPNLDKLATEGVRFPNTFTAAGVCAPSRTAHITGMHQISVGGQHMRARDFKTSKYQAVPPAEVKAYPELLRKAGYYTFTNFKLDYQFSDINDHTGPFTIWDDEGRKVDWNNRGKDQPFFGFINYKESHESQLFNHVVKKNRAKGKGLEVVKPEEVAVPPYYPDLPMIRKDIAQQYNNITSMDKAVGKILAKLEKDGLADNTIVIWTTDHGDGFPRAKREVYDSGIKVPMIIHWPKNYQPDNAKAGSIDERLISFVDFGPSIMTILGLDVPEYMHGSAQFGKNTAEKRKYIYASKDRLDGLAYRERAVRSEQFKYIRNYLPNMPGGQHIKYRDGLNMMQALWQHFEQGKMNAAQRFWFEPRPAEELYDIVNDPHEINNLANDNNYQTKLAKMQGALQAWQQQVTDLSQGDELAMAQAFWPNGQQPQTQSPDISITRHGKIILSTNTTGASLGYQINNGDWQLYSKAIVIKADDTLVAKAIRYGWKESEETVFKVLNEQ